jgi:hypothetical protein
LVMKIFKLAAFGAVTFVVGCTGLAPSSMCPDLSGRYLSEDAAAADGFATFLFGKSPPAASSTLVRSTSDGLSLRRGGSTAAFHLAQDFSCGPSEIRLGRTQVSHVKLPPLIDQTTTKFFVMKPASDGGIRVEVYTQTTTAPYGISLAGPKRLETSFEWTRSAPR